MWRSAAKADDSDSEVRAKTGIWRSKKAVYVYINKTEKARRESRRTELTLCGSLLAGLSKYQGTVFKFPLPTTREIRLRRCGTGSFGTAVATSEGPASTSATAVPTSSASRPTTNTWRSQGRRGVESVTLVLKVLDDPCLGRERRGERLGWRS